MNYVTLYINNNFSANFYIFIYFYIFKIFRQLNKKVYAQKPRLSMGKYDAATLR